MTRHIHALLRTAVAVWLALGAVAPALAAPGHDDLLLSRALAGAAGLLFTDNTGATLEPSEPDYGDAASVWFRWTAPADGTVLCRTLDTELDTTLCAFSGATYATTRAQVLSQLADPRREDGDLNLRRSRVGVVTAIFLDELSSVFSGDSHRDAHPLCKNCSFVESESVADVPNPVNAPIGEMPRRPRLPGLTGQSNHRRQVAAIA